MYLSNVSFHSIQFGHSLLGVGTRSYILQTQSPRLMPHVSDASNYLICVSERLAVDKISTISALVY